MWYSEKQFEALDVDKRSLVVASANLAQKFDIPIDPVSFYSTLTQEDEVIDWWNVAEYVDGIDIDHVVEDGSWPDTSLAIVKFRRLDEAAAGLVDHYCLVADHHHHSIVDSLDATIKSAALYGEVVSWASYVPETEAEEDMESLDEATLDEVVKTPSKTIYVLDKGENIWDAARKLGISVNSIISYNKIEDPRTLGQGDLLRIPMLEAAKHDDIVYELLEEPLLMHVSAPSGTTKFSFGNATKWGDIKPTTRRYKYLQPIVVTAIAHVPLAKEKESAKYYMEAVDVGVSPTSDRVQYTVGFSHAHLKEGEPILVRPEPVKLVPEPVVESLITSTVEVPRIMPDMTWKQTQRSLNAERRPVLYLSNESLTVHDLDNKLSPKQIGRFKGVQIMSTFEKDGVLYGRPLQSARQGSWYGIPMDKLSLEDEVYNTNTTLVERMALHGRLSLQERGVVALSKVLSQGTRLKTVIKQKLQ